jgi:hypothetical protein
MAYMAAGLSGDEEATEATVTDGPAVNRVVEREREVYIRRSSGYTPVGARVAMELAAGEDAAPATGAGEAAGPSAGGGAAGAASGAAGQSDQAERGAARQKRARQQEVVEVEEVQVIMYTSQRGRNATKKVDNDYVDPTSIRMEGERKRRNAG